MTDSSTQADKLNVGAVEFGIHGIVQESGVLPRALSTGVVGQVGAGRGRLSGEEAGEGFRVFGQRWWNQSLVGC
jgi:hypothetical protein